MDAKIGIGFEKKRTKSQIWNKMRYAYEGFKKLFWAWAPIPKIANLIENMKVGNRVIFQADELKVNPVNIIALNIETMFGADI